MIKKELLLYFALPHSELNSLGFLVIGRWKCFGLVPLFAVNGYIYTSCSFPELQSFVISNQIQYLFILAYLFFSVTNQSWVTIAAATPFHISNRK